MAPRAPARTALGLVAVLAAVQQASARRLLQAGLLANFWSGINSILMATDANVYTRPMSELVTPRGYGFEEHYPITDDGYILGLYRIPPAVIQAASSNAPRRVALLWHGLEDGSTTFVVNPGPNESKERSGGLAFVMADAGYDVWMANSRGTYYSCNHTTLSVNSDAFWDFTLEDMALKDTPTVVNYVLNATGASELYYVGHSQGTTTMLMAGSQLEHIPQQIAAAALLAPVGSLRSIASDVLRELITIDLPNIVAQLGMREFLPGNITSWLLTELCAGSGLGCDRGMANAMGYSDQINDADLDYYLHYWPSGTSVKNLQHWAQLYHAAQIYTDGAYLARYDYGNCSALAATQQPCSSAATRCNECVYGADGAPPRFDLARYSIPTVLISGSKDELASPSDVQDTVGSLPDGAVRAHKIVDYAHMDFVWGQNSSTDVYDGIVSFFETVA